MRPMKQEQLLMKITPKTKTKIDFFALDKSRTERNLWTDPGLVAMKAIHIKDIPIDIVQKEILTKGLGFKLNREM